MSPDNLDIQNSLDKDLIASVSDLKVYFESKQGMVHSVDGVSFDIVDGDKVIRQGTHAYITPKREQLERDISI